MDASYALWALGGCLVGSFWTLVVILIGMGLERGRSARSAEGQERTADN